MPLLPHRGVVCALALMAAAAPGVASAAPSTATPNPGGTAARALRQVQALAGERRRAQETIQTLAAETLQARTELADQQARRSELQLEATRARLGLEDAERSSSRVLAPVATLSQQGDSAVLQASSPEGAPLVYEEERALLADRAHTLSVARINSLRLATTESEAHSLLTSISDRVETVERDTEATRLLEGAITRSMRAPLARLAHTREGLAALIDAIARPGTVPAAATPAWLSTLAPAGRVVTAARRELALGVHEEPEGSNLSPGILRYETATAGSIPGQPWCAYFASYVAWEAGVPVGPGGQGIGYVPTLKEWAEAEGRFTPAESAAGGPLPGDLFVLPEHTGVVVEVRAGWITTIEGNYENKVAEVHRPIASVLGYIRLWGAPPSAPGASLTGPVGG